MTYPFKGRHWLLLFVLLCKNFNLSCAEPTPIVLVSVAPHKFFVEQIAKESVQVHLMVPAGASSHTYEPTPRQMVTAGQAKLWFRIGEPFENRAVQALTSHHPDLEIIDLRQGLDHPNESRMRLLPRICSTSISGSAPAKDKYKRKRLPMP